MSPSDLTPLQVHILATALALEAIGLRNARIAVYPTKPKKFVGKIVDGPNN